MERSFIDCPKCGEDKAVMFRYERLYGKDNHIVERTFCKCSVQNLNENFQRDCLRRMIRAITNIDHPVQ